MQWEFDTGPSYKSAPGADNIKPGEITDEKIFEGCFIPASDGTTLAIFSDDGCNVEINGTCVHENFLKPQHLPKVETESFHILKASLTSTENFSFKKDRVYTIRVRYSNTIYLGNEGIDIDGCTLFAFNGGGTVQECPILDIYFPQDGQMVAQDKKATIGSFTITNINDTNGNGKPDVDDDNVLVARTILRSQGSMLNPKRNTILFVENATKFAKDVDLDKDAKGDYLPTLNGAPNRIRIIDSSVSELAYMAGIDVKQNRIVITTQLSRAYEKGARVEVGEVDLMKLVVHAPAGEGKLTLTVEKGADQVKLWLDPNKQPFQHESILCIMGVRNGLHNNFTRRQGCFSDPHPRSRIRWNGCSVTQSSTRFH